MSATIPTHGAAIVGDSGVAAPAPPVTMTSDERLDLTPQPRSIRFARLGLWITIPLGCATWVAVTSTHYYFVYDEWVTIERTVTGSWFRQLFIGFNGHMWSVPFALYSLQVNAFGLETSWFLPLVLVVTLVALQISVAGVLSRLGLPTLVALLAATVVTYFGPGAETMVWQHLLGYNLAFAFTCGAAYVALGKRHDRRTALVVAAFLIAALFSDGALAPVGLLLVVALIVILWPARLAALALVPAVIAHAAWFALDKSEILFKGACQNCPDVRFPASVGGSIRFGWAILARAAGGLVGGSVTAGAIVVVLAVALFGAGLLLRRLPRRVIASFIGGAVAAVAAAGFISYSRAGFWHTIDEGIQRLDAYSNRYVEHPAIFLMIAIAPVVGALIEQPRRLVSWLLTATASVGLVVVFALNVGTIEKPTRHFYEAWGSLVKSEVRQAVTVVVDGCNPGERLDPEARPVESSFQITVGLLERLIDRGALTAQFGRPAPAEMRAKICRPT